MPYTPNPPISFAAFLKHGGNLQRNNGAYIAHFHHGDKLAQQVISEEEIAAYEARLPEVLRAMFDDKDKRKTAFSTSRVYTQSINNTLRYWEHPVRVKLLDGRDMYINAIDRIWIYPTQNNTAKLGVSCHAYLNRIGELTYVEDTVRKDVEVPVSELDKYYPGWSVRYDMLSQLGYQMQEMVDQVFKKPDALAPMPLGDISFEGY